MITFHVMSPNNTTCNFKYGVITNEIACIKNRIGSRISTSRTVTLCECNVTYLIISYIYVDCILY